MGHKLGRRQLLHVSTVATISVAGCLDVGIGGRPERVPFEVVNQNGRTVTVAIEFSDSDTDDLLLSETVELPPDSEREFEVGSIDSQARYTVQYEVGDRSGESSISGSGVRGVELRIEQDGDVNVYSTAS